MGIICKLFGHRIPRDGLRSTVAITEAGPAVFTTCGRCCSPIEIKVHVLPCQGATHRERAAVEHMQKWGWDWIDGKWIRHPVHGRIVGRYAVATIGPHKGKKGQITQGGQNGAVLMRFPGERKAEALFPDEFDLLP